MDFDDALPCGGYEQEDKKIQKNLKSLSLEADGQQMKQQQKACDACDTMVPCCKNNKKQQAKQQKLEQINDPKRKVLCKKCKQNQAVLSHKNQIICKECLMKNIEYKTRLTLENKIHVKGTSKVLLCFSGGLNSICMVNIMNNIKKRYQKHPLFGELECLHIKQQQKLPDNYANIFEEFTGLKLHIIPIERIFRDQEKDFEYISNLFKELPQTSNSIDLLQLFREQLILQFGEKNGFDFIMEGKNGQSLAAEIFKYFSKGIGGNTGQLCSNEPGPFSYPLRQHLQKELQYYFYAERLGKISMLAADDDLSNTVSTQLDNFLNNFITTLQDRYSHTSPAIVRTGQKLKSNYKQNVKKCEWCYLSHNLSGNLCQKCVRLQQAISKDPNITDKLPKWMKNQL